ncbi:MAG TPA: 50S ribosomal protein L32 [Polyangiaceae bacterium]
MAVPKRRLSSSKGKMRRANHDKVSAPNLVPCTNCSAPTVPHRVCAACGFYKGRAVVKTEPSEG